MSSTARSRAAERAARTRVARLCVRGFKKPRSTREVDLERAAQGRITVAEQRRGLPTRGEARRAATHEEVESGAQLVGTEDPDVFGVLVADPFLPGDEIVLASKLDETSRRSATVVECAQIGRTPGYYMIALT